MNHSYWPSTQIKPRPPYHNDLAYYVSFFDGYVGNSYKFVNFQVRAVRAF